MRPPWKTQQEKQENDNVRKALRDGNYDVCTELFMLIFHSNSKLIIEKGLNLKQ